MSREEFVARAKELFGWAGGLGGFEDAVNALYDSRQPEIDKLQNDVETMEMAYLDEVATRIKAENEIDALRAREAELEGRSSFAEKEWSDIAWSDIKRALAAPDTAPMVPEWTYRWYGSGDPTDGESSARGYHLYRNGEHIAWLGANNEASKGALSNAVHTICQELNHQYKAAPMVPEGWKLELAKVLEAVQNAMLEAYNNAGQVCCGRYSSECCGSPEPEWSVADVRIMDVLSPVQRLLSGLMTASPPAPMVPEGWKLVPIEPTDEMIEVGCDVANAYRVDIARAYEAMLAAAPEVKS